MRKIISFMHLSLDGIVAGPNGEMDWIKANAEIFDYVGKHDVDERLDLVLLGVEEEDEVEHGHGALLVLGFVGYPAALRRLCHIPHVDSLALITRAPFTAAPGVLLFLLDTTSSPTYRVPL